MLLKDKIGIVIGIANRHSIAAHIANVLYANGAKMVFSYFPGENDQKMLMRIKKVVDDLKPILLYPCDIARDKDIDIFSSHIKSLIKKKIFNKIDFIIHSVAFASLEEIKKDTIDISRKGFKEALDISVYSLIKICQSFLEFMDKKSSVISISYYGAEKVVPGYNIMGICKSALETSIRYLAFDLGKKKIRINAISAGPLKTAASSALNNFTKILEINKKISPLNENITGLDIANTALYLTSDLSTHVTGEIIHVDSGFNIMSAI